MIDGRDGPVSGHAAEGTSDQDAQSVSPALTASRDKSAASLEMRLNRRFRRRRCDGPCDGPAAG